MRVVIQRVTEARVIVADQVVGQISAGLCVFLGVGVSDNESNAAYLADKIIHLRIFEDEQGKMNRSAADVRAEILLVSQFTLYGDCKKGNRPSFTEAAPPAEAERLYHCFIDRLKASGLKVATGQFQAKMDVALKNDGPVTFVLEN
ncbi:MAG TPA: D-aminoacyl-tRNA deacylase [Methylomirabilota bacterium]|nr:D-aminoacyl-tRNA deacylase [Methylomirabilota bacterium]